jgi:hypothetical protein
MNATKKYSEFARAIVAFQRAIVVPLALRPPPLLWWQTACVALIPNDEVMRDKLAQRLGMSVGTTYGDGAASFLSLLRSHMTGPSLDARWSA